MVFVYLGLFSSILNWVFDKILSPITKWLGGILSDLFSWMVNKLIIPAIQVIIEPLLKQILQIIYTALAGVFYTIFAVLLDFLNTLNGCFDTFIGLSDVTVKTNGQTQQMKLLDVFFTNTQIAKVFWFMTIIGFALCFLFAIYAVGKSAFDLEFEGKRPVSRVISMLIQAMIHMFTMQFFVYFLVRLAGAILVSIDNAMVYGLNGGGVAKNVPTLGGIIFGVAALNAASNENYNMDHGYNVDFSNPNDPRHAFVYGDTKFNNFDKVKSLFKFEKFDFVVGYLVAIFMIVIMAACLMVFIRRLFDMIVLYLVSPYFVAMLPLDDGERFKKWRELFLGKAFSGYGMVISMKLYLMLVPLIMGNNLVFSAVNSSGQPTSPEFDYVVKVLFLVGGAWAILKSGPMVTSLISEAAGKQETDDAKAGVAVASFAGGLAWSATKYAGSKAKKAITGKKDQDKEGGENSKDSKNGNKFDKKQNLSSKGGGKAGKALAAASAVGGAAAKGAKAGVKAGAKGAKAGVKAGAKGAKAGVKAGAKGAKAGIKAGAKGAKAGIKAGAKAGLGAGAKAGIKAAPGALGKKNANYFSRVKSQQTGSYLGGLIKSYKYDTGKKDENGNTIWSENSFGVNLGIFGKYGATEGGKGFSALGFSYRVGADKKSASWSMLGTHFKTNQDGKMHFERANFLGLVKGSANEKTGGFGSFQFTPIGLKVGSNTEGGAQFEKLGLLGLTREKNTHGEYQWTGGLGLWKKTMQEDGNFHNTSFLGGLYSQSYVKDEDGKLTRNSVKLGGFNLHTDHALNELQAQRDKEAERLRKKKEIMDILK